MSFSAELRETHADLFTAFWEHPFLAGLRDGTLTDERVVHYIGQDHQYLSAFIRCYGLGMARSPDRDWMAFFSENVRFLLEDETHPHQALCRSAGVTYEEVQVDRLAPSAQAYVDHITAAGHDSLAVLMGALLPCPWTYVWAGTRLLEEAPPATDHPFREWWEFYGSPDCQALVAEFTQRFDLLAATAGPHERERMARAFEASAHHEVRFWEMAWNRETWTAPAGLTSYA